MPARKNAHIFAGVTGFVGGKNNTTLMKLTQLMATIFTGFPHFPNVYGPSTNLTRCS